MRTLEESFVTTTGSRLQHARRLQKEWFGRLNDVFASPRRVKRSMRLLHPIIKQLTHSGVLLTIGMCFPTNGQIVLRLPSSNNDLSLGSHLARMNVIRHRDTAEGVNKVYGLFRLKQRIRVTPPFRRRNRKRPIAASTAVSVRHRALL